MAATVTITFPRPITAIDMSDAASDPTRIDTAQAAPPTGSPPVQDPTPTGEQSPQGRQQAGDISRHCGTINSIAAKLKDLYEESVSRNRSDIAKLAVEIARKILKSQVDRGDYNIQSIVEEALRRAPTRQNIIIRVNPEDVVACQQLQKDNPNSPLSELDFAADWSIARADCIVETPKGVVRSFVEEHLARIGEALERAQ
jgi:flagellar biosynthesis/type III secretory pathway protein FliH